MFIVSKDAIGGTAGGSTTRAIATMLTGDKRAARSCGLHSCWAPPILQIGNDNSNVSPVEQLYRSAGIAIEAPAGASSK